MYFIKENTYINLVFLALNLIRRIYEYRLNYLPFNVSILVLVYPKPPLPYGLPKVNKDDIPMRLIVSSIGSARYNLAKYVAKQYITKIYVY